MALLSTYFTWVVIISCIVLTGLTVSLITYLSISKVSAIILSLIIALPATLCPPPPNWDTILKTLTLSSLLLPIKTSLPPVEINVNNELNPSIAISLWVIRAASST